MELVTQEVRDALPGLHTSSGERHDLVPIKFFDPTGSWTWYVIEFDGEDTFFGYVDGNYPEFGYFSLKELSEVEGMLGIGIERDINWQPKTIGEIVDSVNARVRGAIH